MMKQTKRDRKLNTKTLLKTSTNLCNKLKIIKQAEAGAGFDHLGKKFNLPSSTITNIVQKKDELKKRYKNVNSTSINKRLKEKNRLISKMEVALEKWIKEEGQFVEPLNRETITDEALNIWHELIDQDEAFAMKDLFKATRVWYTKFKKRINLQDFETFADTEESNVNIVESYRTDIIEILKRGNYPKNLIFNVDETGLFWKRFPADTFISLSEQNTEEKDRVTLLLGGNASGDFKINPLVIYHTETPPAMAGYSKDHLPIVWRSNRKASMSQEIFSEWLITFFCPAVKNYSESIGLEPRALLIFDNEPCHGNLKHIEAGFPIEVVILPRSVSSQLQPMNQGIITTFKACYLRRTLKQLLNETDPSDRKQIFEWWKKFDIMKAINNIDEAWDEISQSCIRSCWQRLCINTNEEDDLPKDDYITIIRSICNLATEVGFAGFSDSNVKELLFAYAGPVTTQELKELEPCAVKETFQESVTSSTKVLTKEIVEQALSLHEQCLELLEKYDNNFSRFVTVKRTCNIIFKCYRQIIHGESCENDDVNLEFLY